MRTRFSETPCFKPWLRRLFDTDLDPLLNMHAEAGIPNVYYIRTRIHTNIQHLCITTCKRIAASEMNIFKYFRNHHSVSKGAVGFVPTTCSLDPHLLYLDTPLQLTLMAATLLLQPASFCLPSRPRVVPQVTVPSSVSCHPHTGLCLFSYWSVRFHYILRPNLLFVLCCKFLLPAVVCLLPFLWYFIIFLSYKIF